MKRSSRGVFFACAAVLGCSGGVAPAKPTSTILPEGQVARAGAELVSAVTVARIVQRQSIAPGQAAGAAVSDALFAQGARESLAAGMARSIERAAVARALLEDLSREAHRAGPPTDAELADVMRDRWADLDRPDGVRTSHAVVMNDKPERDAAAKELAQKLANFLKGVASGDELVKKAQAFPGEGFDVKAEKLPFITADGRSFQHRDAGFAAAPALFDVAFARAANSLEQPGQLSAITKTSFGYHVILLEERAPKQVVPKEQLPALLTPDVETHRTARARRELLERLHQAASVQLDRAFDELTANVKVAP